MTMEHAQTSFSRKIYMVLSSKALVYARTCLQTLVTNALEPLDIVLITDSSEDKEMLCRGMEELTNTHSHSWRVVEASELADLESSVFAGYPNLQNFRRGHPCWRKITDPLLLSKRDDEIVILDPDLYFPNCFCFDQTPPQGLLLMWQKPNCLLPAEVVYAAMESGIRLARHVDIGVAQWRSNVDLDWVEWMLGRLGGEFLPRKMHVEAIVWAAIAMRVGGGYLDPEIWVCWHRSAWKRIQKKLGLDGQTILGSEQWEWMKGFHAGGEAKWWLAQMEPILSPTSPVHQRPSRFYPFQELTQHHYHQEELQKSRLRLFDVFGVLR